MNMNIRYQFRAIDCDGSGGLDLLEFEEFFADVVCAETKPLEDIDDDKENKNGDKENENGDKENKVDKENQNDDKENQNDDKEN